jgi:hypothetical protein
MYLANNRMNWPWHLHFTVLVCWTLINIKLFFWQFVVFAAVVILTTKSFGAVRLPTKGSTGLPTEITAVKSGAAPTNLSGHGSSASGQSREVTASCCNCCRNCVSPFGSLQLCIRKESRLENCMSHFSNAAFHTTYSHVATLTTVENAAFRCVTFSVSQSTKVVNHIWIIANTFSFPNTASSNFTLLKLTFQTPPIQNVAAGVLPRFISLYVAGFMSLEPGVLIQSLDARERK